MTQHEASRTLVKSPPELWAECSDASSLARHLGRFGEIRITRLEPETAVAWEGEHTSGTVRLEPSGWGTRVVLTAMASPADPEPEHAPTPEPEPQPVLETEPEPMQRPAAPPRRGLFGRIAGYFGAPGYVTPAPAAPAPPPSVAPVRALVEPAPVVAEPEPVVVEPLPESGVEPTQAALTAALDSLGQAHHRPFSRA